MLIYIPNRWQPFRGYSTESESFDPHNFVKAFCVQRGIATQFLNQDTLSDTYFVGLGFSIDPNAQSGNHVVLGCSHIYSARGEGLQYRLSKIENPIIRRGNPFMPARMMHGVSVKLSASSSSMPV